MLRPEVAAIVRAGPFPTEESDEVEPIEQAQRLLEAIPEPVTDEEAYALLSVFGEDYCFGLAGALVHIIETAPGSCDMTFPRGTGKLGIERLIARQDLWLEMKREEQN